MNRTKFLLILIAICFWNISAFPQNKPAFNNSQTDSLLKNVEILLFQQQKQQQLDSLKKIQLIQALLQANGDKQKTRILEKKLKLISINDSVSKAVQLNKIAELKKSSKSYPIAPFDDTLFFIHTKIGSFSAKDRATLSAKELNNYTKTLFIL